jgi:hypothetical protein
MQGIILHKKNLGQDYPCFSPQNYDIAATFDYDTTDVDEFLERAYEATNSIDYHWSENEGVLVSGDYSKRSTSVGDIIWIETKIYEVAPFGFSYVTITN